MTLDVRSVLASCVAGLVGCFGPTYPEGLACGAGETACPPDQTCGADGRCRRVPLDAAADALVLGTFGPLVPIDELNSANNDQDPATSVDGLEIFFVSDRPGGLGANDIWVATRMSTDEPFANLQVDAMLNATGNENHPWLAPGGKEIYFDSDRDGESRIYRSRRDEPGKPWGPPMLVPELDAVGFVDSGTSITADGKALVFTSDRDGNRDLYFSTRGDAGATWSTPMRLGALSTLDIETGPGVSASELYWARQDPMTLITSIWRAPYAGTMIGDPEVVSELGAATDPMISEDGRTLYLSSVGQQPGLDLFVTTR